MEPEINKDQSTNIPEQMDNIQLPKKNNSKVLISLIVMLLIAVAAGVYVFFFLDKSKNTTSDQASTTQTNTAVESNNTTTGDADIDAEIALTDKAVGAIDDDTDFGADTLSDTEVGL